MSILQRIEQVLKRKMLFDLDILSISLEKNADHTATYPNPDPWNVAVPLFYFIHSIVGKL